MIARRPATVFAGAALLAIVVAFAARDTLGFVVRQPDGHYEGDITHYVYWTRLVTLGGIQDAYKGTWPETFAVYPPVTLYPYWVIGTLYRATQDPTFDVQRALDSRWLLYAIKAVAVGWHLAAATAIFLLGRRLYGARLGTVAGSLFVLNPAALFDTAHWGQLDGAHSLFSVSAIGLLQLGAVLPGWGAMALAALAKPQAWAILPLVTLATWRDHGLRFLVKGALVGAAVAAVVLLPFLVTGRLGEFFRLPSVLSSVMPAVTGNAHNTWWLYFAIFRPEVDPIFTDDTARLVGPLSYRLVAGLSVGAQFLVSYWLYWTRRAGLAEAAALGALGWFLFTTQAHENHLFFVLPLLSLSWPGRPRLLWVMGVLTLTVLANMALHDQLLLEALGSDLADPAVGRLRTLNALANLATYAAWLVWAARRRPALPQPSFSSGG